MKTQKVDSPFVPVQIKSKGPLLPLKKGSQDPHSRRLRPQVWGVVALLSITFTSLAQPYTRQDSLRGMITPEREWWDLKYYHLDIEVIPDDKTIQGSVIVNYQVLRQDSILQIDLQRPLRITKVEQDDNELDFRSEGNAHFITLKKEQNIDAINSLIVHYSGKPRKAVNAPWDGGISWKKDRKYKPFIASSCQGLGASVWWPCKDHMYDEADSMLISVEVPAELVDVSNGRLHGIDTNEEKNTKTYHWFVNNPINNYGVNINIGNYVNWKEVYQGEKGPLDITYWPLEQDLKKAKKQFKEVPKMLKAFEHWFGPYPFYEDGYQLVQAPYLGMEHQSSITYGNNYQQGYLGRDLSDTGWGLKFDFIIIHESGHEWFANSITHRDAADMWVHEGFTAYSESLFLDYYHGKAAGQEYVRGTRNIIQNRFPMVGPYDVNHEHHDSDIYYKGANVLNMVREILDDDEKWRQILRGLCSQFYHQTVTTKQIENYIIQQSGINLKPLFDQFLRTTQIPIIQYYFKDGKLFYKWTNCIDRFNMPVDMWLENDTNLRLLANDRWQSIDFPHKKRIQVNPNYYVGAMRSR